ncbi:MAG: hypothetical protein WKG32_09105 [Gemmatimonadaceae bacterium]
MDARQRRCREKFLRYFPQGFHDPKYLDWERDYKWEAHERWEATLGPAEFDRLLGEGEYAEIALRAVRLESATNLLFSFEKMALRDAVKPPDGSRCFAEGLHDLAYRNGDASAGGRARFERFADTLAALPRKQTRVHTWPLQTVFGFLARPRTEIFLKPMVTRAAARAYGFDFRYESRPNWGTYASLLEFGQLLERDLADLRPRDMIDIQSFIWLLGSSEYDGSEGDDDEDAE